jgi:hypothetical protein
MCGPLAAAAGAAMAGSVLANKMGADQQAGARSNVLNQANADRMGYMQQATDKFNQTLPLASREAQDAAGKTAAGNRLASDTATLDANGNVIPPPSTQTVPGDVSSAFANAARDSRQRGLIQANANANVGGYADANKVLGINLEKAGEWQKIFG